MIFREAKKCNVVLFFDECDTLFAKRSLTTAAANQASNNNKTALLLQEVEAYDGVSVLATNYKHNIDPAFFRRMKFIVEFQFPDPETRYRSCGSTTIPKGTPLAEDVDLDFLAERFEFVGGNIKNCILNAAFLAAVRSGGRQARCTCSHYLQAIRYEFVKTGKVFTRSDFEPYARRGAVNRKAGDPLIGSPARFRRLFFGAEHGAAFKHGGLRVDAAEPLFDAFIEHAFRRVERHVARQLHLDLHLVVVFRRSLLLIALLFLHVDHSVQNLFHGRRPFLPRDPVFLFHYTARAAAAQALRAGGRNRRRAHATLFFRT